MHVGQCVIILFIRGISTISSFIACNKWHKMLETRHKQRQTWAYDHLRAYWVSALAKCSMKSTEYIETTNSICCSTGSIFPENTKAFADFEDHLRNFVLLNCIESLHTTFLMSKASTSTGTDCIEPCLPSTSVISAKPCDV